jgi:ABC-type lipoprotein export system ATPase subunit
MSSFYVKSIKAKGIYGKYDLQYDFQDGLNIIYGKNGAGKTTLMHILANALNGDFSQFEYLEFRSIEISLSDDKLLVIKKKQRADDQILEARINDVLIYPTFLGMDCNSDYFRRLWEEMTIPEDVFGNSDYSLRWLYDNDDIEEDNDTVISMWVDYFLDIVSDEPTPRNLRTILSNHVDEWLSGQEINPFLLPKTAYLPAFRAILETKDAAHSEILDLEDFDVTDLARSMFGKFTPAVNFPSILEIETHFKEELDRAKERILENDRILFYKAFLEVFTAFSENEPVSPGSSGALEEIEGILHELEQSPLGIKISSIPGIPTDSSIYSHLKESVSRLYTSEGNLDPQTIRILHVYKGALIASLQEHKRAFAKIERYKAVVNKFLGAQIFFDYSIDSGSYSSPDVGLRSINESQLSRLGVLSSGERQIFTLLFATTHMESPKVVLIDEPEISLHIDWQRKLLSEIFEHTGKKQIIVCTHSPIIAADFQEQMEELKFIRYHPKRVRPRSKQGKGA